MTMLQELSIGVVLIAFIVFLANPFHLWMPDVFVMVLTTGFVLAFAAFAVFVWREQPRDEREGLHRAIAGRFAFLAGSATLVMAMVIQSFRHELDPWLPTTLGIMVLAKIVGFVYGRRIH